MDRYEARISLRGTDQRERNLNRLKQDILNKVPSNPSYKEIRLNGEDTYLVINTGTKPYYKEFESLPGQKILAGDYVEWSNNIWLVYEADSDDEIYTDGNLRQCQYELFWQNSDGKIISRHAWVQNASAYNNGESGNSTITLQSNQFMVYMPYDDDTLLLDNGLRMHISRSNRKCKPYKLTRPDDIAMGYGEKGVLGLVFTQDEYNPTEDKLIELEDDKSVWICKYFSPTPPPNPDPPDETANLFAHINFTGSNIIRIGGNKKKFTATLTDNDGNNLDMIPIWTIEPEGLVDMAIVDKELQISCDDENMDQSSLTISVRDEHSGFSTSTNVLISAF